jgi:hypothetical protein
MRRSRKPLYVLLAYREFESLPLRWDGLAPQRLEMLVAVTIEPRERDASPPARLDVDPSLV